MRTRTLGLINSIVRYEDGNQSMDSKSNLIGVRLGAVVAVFFLVIFAASSTSSTSGTPGTETRSAGPTTAPVSRQGWQAKWEDLKAVAKREGKVTIYANLGPDTSSALKKAMAEKYHVDVDFVVAAGAELEQKLLTERNAGIFLADVFMAGATLPIDLKAKGVLQPVAPLILLPEVKDASVWAGKNGPYMDKETMVVALIASYNRYLLRNTNMVKESEISSYRDLLKPQYKGKIVMTDPTTSGTGNAWVGLLVDAWGMDQTMNYLKAMVKQEPMLSRDRRLVMEWVAKGKYGLAVAPNTQVAAQFMRRGSPLAYVKMDEGGDLTPVSGVLSLPTNAPHPAATTVFTNWLLSKEGQELFARSFGSPSARKDVSTQGMDSAFLPQPGEVIRVDSEERVLVRSGLLPATRNALAALFK